ncbi:hypothetical protein Q1695_011826 [Nippostrongylus brasiliensis]|nr:hypothetical protein Q1695_011826 [Nippostrongylus brasiliensis]
MRRTDGLLLPTLFLILLHNIVSFSLLPVKPDVSEVGDDTDDDENADMPPEHDLGARTPKKTVTADRWATLNKMTPKDHGGVTKSPIGAGNNPWAMPNQPMTNHGGVTKPPFGAGNNPWAMPNQPRTNHDGVTKAPLGAGNNPWAMPNQPKTRGYTATPTAVGFLASRRRPMTPLDLTSETSTLSHTPDNNEETETPEMTESGSDFPITHEDPGGHFGHMESGNDTRLVHSPQENKTFLEHIASNPTLLIIFIVGVVLIILVMFVIIIIGIKHEKRARKRKQKFKPTWKEEWPESEKADLRKKPAEPPLYVDIPEDKKETNQAKEGSEARARRGVKDSRDTIGSREVERSRSTRGASANHPPGSTNDSMPPPVGTHPQVTFHGNKRVTQIYNDGDIAIDVADPD